jgi:hypothetical protein
MLWSSGNPEKYFMDFNYCKREKDIVDLTFFKYNQAKYFRVELQAGKILKNRFRIC